MENQHLMQAYRQSPWRIQVQIAGLFLLGVVLVALVAGIYLNVTARAATIGRRIQQMQESIQLTQRLNADLETELATLTTASVMEARAKDLGFQTLVAEELDFVSVPGYPGRRALVLAPPPSPVAASTPPLPPEFTQSLFDLVREITSNSRLSLLEIR